MPNKKGQRRRFGSLRRLPSGRVQASYLGPDMVRHTAPRTFDAMVDATAWLDAREREIERGTWKPPTREKPKTLREYADRWLAERDNLRPRTRDHYRWLLDSRIVPELGGVPLEAITGPLVRSWHAGMGTATPTARAHAVTGRTTWTSCWIGLTKARRLVEKLLSTAGSAAGAPVLWDFR